MYRFGVNFVNFLTFNFLQDESSTLYIPVTTPTIKNPIVVLERCDKIWETLQLIKTVQTDNVVTIKDEKDYNEENYNEEECSEEKKEEEAQAEMKVEEEHSAPPPNEAVQPTSYKKNLRARNKMVSLPFKFSVQRTKKLYPCETCGKQYLERRSLRKHSEREHGIILPLQRKRKILIRKRNLNIANSIARNTSDNSEKHDCNKDSYGKITAETKFKSLETVAQQSTLSKRFVRCALCQQKVMSIRKHLTHYHKIGGSSSVIEQLESSLVIDNKAPSENKKTKLKNILSGKLPSTTQHNEENVIKTSSVKRKQHNLLSYLTIAKRLKLNNERPFVRDMPTTKQQRPLIVTNYKCDVCLGMYSSTHSLYKHKRNHLYRGETRENFHNFKCRYLNSPLNKRYQLSTSSTDTTASNICNNININNSKHRELGQNNKISSNRKAHYNGRRNSKNETTCICGRSFRNPHTLFVHKEKCKLCKNEDQLEQLSDDKDSTNGISITIKKRNDSYEIVGKDNDNENMLPESIPVEGDNVSDTFNSTLKSSTDASTVQQELNTSISSNYSKDHSIVKLEAIEEDMIIDIEDDVQINANKNNTAQVVMQENDEKYSSKQNNIKKNMKKQVSTLKEMCQEVLDVLEKPKIENDVENKTQENYQIKDQVMHQQICQENRRELRSSGRQRQSIKKEFNISYDGAKSYIMFDPLSVCGYCDEEFDMINTYEDHECTVKEGKPFDEFSLQLLCFFCKDILNNYTDYDKHMKVKHSDDAYHCYQCAERFTTDRARLNHFHKEHNDSFCRFCKKQISISVKAYHEGYHLGFGYPCHRCKKAYTMKRNLSYHTSTIHAKEADKLITCNICLRLVKFKTFRRHMNNHKHNACHFCGKLFSNRTGLELHTMIQHKTHSKSKGMKKKNYDKIYS